MFKNAESAPRLRACLAAALGSSAILLWSAALPAAEENVADEELAEVQVTGTRIQQRPGYETPNPVTTVTGEDLRKLGIVNVADAMTTIVPQNMSFYQPAMAGDEFSGRGAFFIGNTIANLRGLDPSFGTRTLTLVDGRRMVSTSNQADVVDLNIIPSNLLARADVVTGGASAAYGSGAMAGVVNLVLDRRRQGISLDMDYGFNEAGDGGNPHVALSGGTSLFEGRGHALLGLEWQKQSAIRNCAADRDWCAESRSLLTNSSQFGLGNNSTFVPLPGFENNPGHFQISNVRYNQFQPSGAIYSTNVNNLTGLRFTADGTGVEEYTFGYRGGGGGGFGPGTSIGGDGPLTTTGTTLMPSNQRRTVFGNFEYDFNNSTTGYVQANYGKTNALNKNTYTQGEACVRFDTRGKAGATLPAGTTLTYNFASPAAVWSIPAFLQHLGLTPGFIPNFYAGTLANPPAISNATNVVWGDWGAFGFPGNVYIVSLTLTQPFDQPGELPQLGPNAYAFLNQLSPEALLKVQQAFGNSPAAGPGASFLLGNNPCAGYTSIYKVWNPQIAQYTRQESETMRGVFGLKGRYGQDWNYDAYFSYGRTESASLQNNVWTTIRLGFAMDAVLDANGNPVCRVTRDGVPTTDAAGLPLSDPAGIAALAEGCKPLNIFGSTFSDPAAAQLQRDALNYAFQMNGSSGENNLMMLNLSTSGTVWDGWGAGPLKAAFGLEGRRDKVTNAGSDGALYERADYAFGWADAFGGTTQVVEGFSEWNMPLISGRDGINFWNVDAAVRHARYRNKGGAGTTGESLTQTATNWKFSTELSPFDWIRLRLTRSRDLRAAGYRDLFINQPSVPDSAQGQNPWLPWNAATDAQQQDRWGTTTIGNTALKPEKSDTLTMGLVLSPGGWAQGMRFSADYYKIRVKDGIGAAPGLSNPILPCWQGSGNSDPRETIEINGQQVTIINPNVPTTLFDPDFEACRDITFGTNPDGSVDTGNIISYNTGRPVNNDPFWRRGIDLSADYTFPLGRVFESLPGSVSLSARATRAMESSGLCTAFAALFGTCVSGSVLDTVGQISTPAFGYPAGLQATPKWTGNFFTTYSVGDLVMTLSTRYVGGAKINKEYCDDRSAPCWQNADGDLLFGTIDDNSVKPYFNFSLNGSYNLQVGNLRQFQLFGTINNLFDRDPPYSGGYVSGASPQFHDTMGRSYRMGVRLRF